MTYTKKNKLPKISLLLNDVKASSSYGGYYGGYGYGNSYGYGHGGDYFEKEKRKQSGLLTTIKKVFTGK